MHASTKGDVVDVKTSNYAHRDDHYHNNHNHIQHTHTHTHRPQQPPPPQYVETAVLGAGVTGLTAAAYLLSKQHKSLLVIDEKPHDQPGGTWHDHDYPNCGTDTEVATYVRCNARASDALRRHARAADLALTDAPASPTRVYEI